MKMLKGFTIGFLTTMFLTLAVFASAAEVNLSWDPNDPTPTGYRVFSRLAGNGYDYKMPVWEGSATETTAISVPDDTETAFVVRAYKIMELSGAELESADSVEVVYTPDGLTPEPPRNVILRKIIEALSWLWNRFGRG
jgi:hypothetical protein